ncbi:hypothetical protein [uncultured Gammaproteobacteria bacterium]|nr:hypothetical protein BROOK1789B_224 [Bathymodiolus brooksi thiotrophic gill symbiont]CAC9528940.1 hypothetical protein [uncultured Gammaproteobacteria bacterium]CAB9542695.1 hypothetical protein BROOK1789C_417 [Bathymodiolus brooksi thiotrophic gill symbiont]CAC9549956.1 hypothetical protein [uncultured Gammaproteobacteria bacterium]CAC9555567.1 hypothetical protein [uncultured Gammaproteobacteria bacterium]
MFVVDEVGISLVIVVGSSLSINCVNTCGDKVNICGAVLGFA